MLYTAAGKNMNRTRRWKEGCISSIYAYVNRRSHLSMHHTSTNRQYNTSVRKYNIIYTYVHRRRLRCMWHYNRDYCYDGWGKSSPTRHAPFSSYGYPGPSQGPGVALARAVCSAGAAPSHRIRKRLASQRTRRWHLPKVQWER